MTNTESQGAGEWDWFPGDNAYDVSNTTPERAIIGDGKLFHMADKGSARRLVSWQNEHARELSSLRETVKVASKLASRLESLLRWHHVKPHKTTNDGFDVPMHQTAEEMAACERCCNYADALIEYEALTSPEEVNQHEPSA